ncbi:GNAT family N-acetyltransferase [Acrocarpospora catenulata]|uniref:GNAT family N-acetyltransferase n=1 Tax=Acrocarpospora catenulata TaxID=2836182 RepID=UPI001BDA71ED|nr:GNAT family N-acetyltransferase [Acrocarpospora catenulata]
MSQATAQPQEQAERAAQTCGIELRELTEVADFHRVLQLFDDIWHFEPADTPVSVEMMCALSHSGNYVAGAYDGERLVGASVAFLAAPAGQALHSHVTGAVRRGAGFALKLHQRAWALDRGLDRVAWTFDPLVRRNAYFNLAKLGARPEEYLPEFYGPMADEVNAGDESDRVLAVWRLTAPQVAAAASGVRPEPAIPPGTARALSAVAGKPVPAVTTGRVVLVELPEDIEGLRRSDPGTAKAWRMAVREVLGGLLEEGATVTGFARGGYVVERL